jgi:hypothetical protein
MPSSPESDRPSRLELLAVLFREPQISYALSFEIDILD